MVACDIGELPGDDLVEELAASIEEQGGRAGCDVIFLHLEGNQNSSGDIAAVLSELKERLRTPGDLQQHAT